MMSMRHDILLFHLVDGLGEAGRTRMPLERSRLGASSANWAERDHGVGWVWTTIQHITMDAGSDPARDGDGSELGICKMAGEPFMYTLTIAIDDRSTLLLMMDTFDPYMVIGDIDVSRRARLV